MDKSNDTALASVVSFTFDEFGHVVPTSKQTGKPNDNKEHALNEMMNKAFEECKDTLSHTSLVTQLKEIYQISESTAKRRIKQAKEAGILTHKNDLYSLAPF